MTPVTEKNELETLFVDCIEDIRRDVMKRRIKSEVITKKRINNLEKES
jgi:hypothetical protein